MLFAVVSDGIGGHRAGEVAAELAVNYIIEKVSESNGKNPLQIMEAAIHSASEAIASRSASQEEQQGMGATCACVWIEGHRFYIAYVGDSRIYLVRDGSIQRLTVDHTWVQEAVERGIITADAGTRSSRMCTSSAGTWARWNFPMWIIAAAAERRRRHAAARTTTREHALKQGDRLLICTDGLTDMVWDDEILRLILTRNSLQSAAEDLVAQANERGGHDNITVVLIGVPKEGTTNARHKKKGFFSNLLGE